MLTQAELKSILHYDEATGIFTRIKKVNNNTVIGSIAGTKNLGYVMIRVNKVYCAHRLAWLYVYGYFPEYQIDHINGVRDDNRIINLRTATSSQNNRNRLIGVNNKTGYKGVSFCKERNKYIAMIRINGKLINLGRYETAQQANAAYEKKAKESFGDFYKEINYEV